MTDEDKNTHQIPSNEKAEEAEKSKAHHVALIVFEVCLVVFLAISVVLGYGAWRIHKEPVDIAFAKNYVQEQLRNPESGIYSKIDEIVLHWPDLSGPILIGLQNVRLYDSGDHEILKMDDVALGLSHLQLLLGRVVPVALIIKKTDLHVTRTPDNGISFGFFEATKTSQPDYADEAQSDLLGRIIAYLSDTEGSDREDSPLADLESIKLEKARLTIDDHVSNTQWSVPRFDIEASQTRKGLAYSFALHFGIDTEKSVIKGRGDFNRVSKGHTFLVDIQDMDINLVAEKFLQHEVASEPLGGISGEIKGIMAYEKDLMRIPVQIKVVEVEQNVLPKLWPKGLEEEPVTEWLTDKISGGRFYDLASDLTLTAIKDEQKGWQFDAHGINLDFAFAETQVRYLDRLSPVEHMQGKGHLDAKSDTLRIDVESAEIQGMDIKKGRVELFDVMAVGKDSAKINIPVQASLDNVFRFIEQERIGVNHGFVLDDVKGDATFTVQIDMPELRDVKLEDVDLMIAGKGVNSYLPDVVGTLDLSDFAYTATLQNNVLEIKGQGNLDGQKASVVYKRALETAAPQGFKTQVTADLVADNVLLSKLGADLNEFIQGQFPVSVVYTEGEEGKTEKALIKADLTQSVLQIEPFQYKKIVGQSAALDLVAQLQDERVTSVDSLNITGPDLKISNGNIGFTSGGKTSDFASLTFPAGVLGQTKGNFSLIKRNPNTLDFKFDGPVFDLRPFLNRETQEKEEENQSLVFSVQADTLLTNESEKISKGKITASMDVQGRFDLLEMDAVAGLGPLSLRYKPDSAGKRSFDLRAEDAGAALGVFGIYDKIRDGQLVIQGHSQTALAYDRTINGSAQITNFRVRKTPVLGRLLSALSLPGLIQLMDGDGLVFQKMATEFTWEYRPQGSLLKLSNGRTSGNSLGLTFDGTIDHVNNKIDLKGTIIPLSGLNKTLGDLPVIGDILTGGSGSVFAATYTITGTLDNPDVSVNPLSVLTPGILRRILFEQE